MINWLKEMYLWRRSFDEVVDEVSLLVTHDHPRPLVRLQSQRLEGELLQEVHPGISRLTQQLHLVTEMLVNYTFHNKTISKQNKFTLIIH